MLRFHFYPLFGIVVLPSSAYYPHTHGKRASNIMQIFTWGVLCDTRDGRTASGLTLALGVRTKIEWIEKKHAHGFGYLRWLSVDHSTAVVSLSHSKYFECLYFRATPARRILFHFYVFGSIKSGWQWALGASVQCKINITRFDRRPCVLNSIHRW